jgi:hypothetical protein
MGINASRGYTKDLGFNGYSFFGQAYAGAGLKLTFPPPKKGWAQRYYDNASYIDSGSLDHEKIGY